MCLVLPCDGIENVEEEEESRRELCDIPVPKEASPSLVRDFKDFVDAVVDDADLQSAAVDFSSP